MKRKHIIPHPVPFQQKLQRFFIHLFAWIGIAVCSYLLFYLFLDTPFEYRLRKSTERLDQEYSVLQSRYDTLTRILANVSERDKEVYRTIFEAEPYNPNEEPQEQPWEAISRLSTKSNRDLGENFFFKLNLLEKNMRDTEQAFGELAGKVEEMDNRINYIPKIQPIINKDLTLLTTSFGMRIQPFYKSMAFHGGIDYAAPIGTRVFATADGVVGGSDSKKTAAGVSVTIDHGRGYETFYGHLSKATVTKGQRVKQGDIIGLTGNSGLSFAPHLHYEVRFRHFKVDPIHYFFMELSPQDYRRIQKVAAAGMQSLD